MKTLVRFAAPSPPDGLIGVARALPSQMVHCCRFNHCLCIFMFIVIYPFLEIHHQMRRWRLAGRALRTVGILAKAGQGDLPR